MSDITISDKQLIIKEINKLDADNFKLLKQYIIKLNNNKKNKDKIITKKRIIDKTTEKYKLLLKYVNGILKNMNKDEIDDLIDFQNIDRTYIIKKENIDLLNKLAPDLFKCFNKDKCGYYRKTKNIALNCLRGMCKEIGLTLKYKTRNVLKDHYMETFSQYHII